ncbi:ABC transporter permease [Alkaliphilus hydrothermalis]|uniref:ABC-type polysaccharide/polyol phosphate export permease n=1 Tax=Alkaliphilus hydrothermalis TaxID=1482730 RepID=A0ABS2NRX8_9FIRM|nr:ABC transporter permease [Alkaliphilus hydrothermalis]MBM7615700.1 ABC-type polysaccharide/polyol phosphate export permease [Alkaliphilus hydrothermalis]
MNSILIALNVMRRLLRELTSLGFIFIFPVIAAVLAVLMFGGAEPIKLGLGNIPQNDYGLIDYIEATGKYDVLVVEEGNLQELIEIKKIKCGVVFPHEIGLENKIKLISQKQDEDVINLMGELEGYMAAAIGGNPPQVEVTAEEEGKQHQAKVAIGMISMFIIMFIGTGMQLLIEDKRLKTFMRSFCAPLKEYEMALGHLMANFVLGVLQITVFLIVATIIFKYDFGTSILNVFLLLVIFLMTAIGLGIGVVGFVKDGEKYNMVVTIIAVTLSFIGGAFFPIEFMNDFIQKLSNLTPQKWLIEAFLKLWERQSILNIGNEIFILLLFGLVFFTFGVKTLRLTTEDL